MTVHKEKSTSRRLSASIAVIVGLCLCLCVTSFALVWSMVAVEDNVFTTGAVRINLNDSQPVIREGEFLFEPGMTVKRPFFLENLSTCEVYYKLYFQNVSGGLAQVLEVEIREGERVLLRGTPAELTRERVAAAADTLATGERREMEIVFHFPAQAGNGAQGQYLQFDFAADAVQTKNNPEKEFD